MNPLKKISNPDGGLYGSPNKRKTHMTANIGQRRN